ncbi:MAG: hypothetical protein J1E99_04915 [Muribaculaceae bacterium]|nr:hypothetical protein [Muribaculaceae bacterium]
MKSDRGNSFFILFVAILILGALSLLGWEDLTKGRFKSFDLWADVRPGGARLPQETSATVYLDPDLALLDTRVDEVPVNDEKHEMNLSDEEDELKSQSDEDNDEAEELEMSNENISHDVDLHKTEIENDAALQQTSRIEENENAPVEYDNRIEDYSRGNINLRNLKRSFDEAGRRLVRMAVLGDSYIEGDIFTETLRSQLQEKYGGNGVGYVSAHSDIPGFRRSVNQSCSSWENHDFRTKIGKKNAMLQGVISVANEGAATTFEGSKIANAGSWDRSRLFFKTPDGGSLRVRIGKGENISSSEYSYSPSDSIHVIDLEEPTSRIRIDRITPGTIFLGCYLDGDNGVAVDNMSIRGYAGIRHDEISKTIIEETSDELSYDLIILEFGINALSSQQTNYTHYGNQMITVVNHIKELYPEAVILIMGIGDRGEKRGSEIHSMSTVPNMINEQRRVARETGSLFWDTRAAMGGEDAVVEWSKNKEINKDYIHLSFKGGNRLSKLFVEALEKSLK